MGAGGGEADAVEATTRSEELLVVALPTVMVVLEAVVSWAELVEAVVLVSLEDIEVRPLLEV